MAPPRQPLPLHRRRRAGMPRARVADAEERKLDAAVRRLAIGRTPRVSILDRVSGYRGFPAVFGIYFGHTG